MPQHNAKPGHGASKYKGVAWSARMNKWRAQVQLHLGYYDSEEEAGKVYVKADNELRALAENLRRSDGDQQHLRGISQSALGI
jgi:hypothetical protein